MLAHSFYYYANCTAFSLPKPPYYLVTAIIINIIQPNPREVQAKKVKSPQQQTLPPREGCSMISRAPKRKLRREDKNEETH